MSTIQVKPHPDLDPAAWPLLKHPASGGLLDAGGKVPDDGRPWLNDGFTCRLLTDGTILRAGDPLFETPTVTGFEPSPAPQPADLSKTDAAVLPKAVALSAPAAKAAAPSAASAN